MAGPWLRKYARLRRSRARSRRPHKPFPWGTRLVGLRESAAPPLLSATRSIRQVLFTVRRRPTRLLPDEIGVREGVQISVQNAVDIADRKLGAMVLDQPVRSQHVTADLAAEIDIELAVLHLVLLDALLRHLVVVQLGFQLLDGAGTIFVLRPLVLALHHETRRDVRHADRGFGPVHVLSAGAACA